MVNHYKSCLCFSYISLLSLNVPFRSPTFIRYKRNKAKHKISNIKAALQPKENRTNLLDTILVKNGSQHGNKQAKQNYKEKQASDSVLWYRNETNTQIQNIKSKTQITRKPTNLKTATKDSKARKRSQIPPRHCTNKLKYWIEFLGVCFGREDKKKKKKR